MPTPALAVLVTPSAASDVLALQLQIATSLGLPITSWQPLDPSRTILQINANIAAQYSANVSLIAQGGYASYAAAMVDQNGNPITTWMDLIGTQNYNLPRYPATSAAGTVPVTNTGGAYTWSPASPLHFQNPTTGATYTTTGSGTIPGPGTAQIAVQADAAWVGAIGTSAAGTVLAMLTPLAGVTVNALSASMVGTNAETNAHYLSRCISKLAATSPAGASQAYVYVAESLPVFGTTLQTGPLAGVLFTQPIAGQPWGVKSAVTRAITVLGGGGLLQLIAANAAGGLGGCAQNPITAISATGSNPITVTATTSLAHNLSVGDWAMISGALGATIINNAIAGTVAWQVTAVGSPTQFSFQIPVVSLGPAYTGGATVEGGDLGMVDAAVQAQVVPNGYTCLSSAALSLAINVTATVYISGKVAAGGATVAAQACANALANYFATLPIGGINAESANIVPWSEILTAIANANPGTVSVILATPAADVQLSFNQVPVLNVTNFTVLFV